MLVAPLPENEEERIKKLYDLDILDTFEEQAYDDLTYLAARICDVPIALISLVDRDRQFLKSHYGLDVNEVSRELGFCPHAILDNSLTIIEDAARDERFHDNPLVTTGPRVNFYAGAPLIFSGDLRIGTLCIVDHEPRTITPQQQLALEALARQVVSQLELRQSVKELEISEARKQSHALILEKLARDYPLEEVLADITRSIESEINGALCSILLLDDESGHYVTGAAPSLPENYNEAVEELKIGTEACNCSAAAYSGQRVVIEDLRKHSCWQPFRKVISRTGLVSCWMEPIEDSKANVLGVFAIYFTVPRSPNDKELATVEYAAHLAGIAIQQRQKEESLIRAERLAVSANIAKSEFLSNMSHELRTPLNAIMGFGQLLELTVADDEARESAAEIVGAGNHLLELINDILDLSTIEAGKLTLSMEDCGLDKIVDECLSLLKPLAENKAVKIINSISTMARYSIHVDPVRMKQALLNLLSNAIKYNVNGGTVTLSCEVVDGRQLRVSVTDTGKGLSRQQQQKLFLPFERLDADKNIEGTGIGLAISKRLVELMDGAIGFASRPERGSTFWLQVRLSQSGNQSSFASQPEKENVARSETGVSLRKSILYIEDNPANLEMVRKIIEKVTPFRFLSASDASQGLALVDEQHPDLILMDINLPGMDGYAAMQQLQGNADSRDIPVIVVSANAMPDDIQKGQQAGFRDYLTKPINLQTLLDKVRQFLD